MERWLAFVDGWSTFSLCVCAGGVVGVAEVLVLLLMLMLLTDERFGEKSTGTGPP